MIGAGKVLVGFPAKNEEHTIAALVRRARSLVLFDDRGRRLAVQVVVVDDGCDDSTASVARAAGADVLRTPGTAAGLGAAVRTIIEAGVERDADFVAFMDADGEYRPEDLPALIEPIRRGDADYVVGDRFAGGSPDGMPLWRCLGNRAGSLFVSGLLGSRVRDAQSGIRVLGRAATRDAVIHHDYNYAQVLTIGLMRRGYRLAELPVGYRRRGHGRTFIRLDQYLRHVLPAALGALARPDGKQFAPPMPAVLGALALFVFAWVSIGTGAPAARFAHTTADEPQYLMTAISLGADADLDIADERGDAAYEPFHAAEPHKQDRLQADGTRVSPHDPLLPALLAAPMRLAGPGLGWIAAKLTLAALAGLLAAAMAWVAIRRFGVSTLVGVSVAAAFSIAAPLAVYGTQVYPELPAALAVTLVVGALCGPLRTQGVIGVAVGVVALPWLSVKYVPVAGVLALLCALALVQSREWRRAIAFGSGLVAAAGLYVVAHQILYDGWTVYAAGHFVEQADVIGHGPDYLGRSQRLVGLLIDRDFGLAVWAPLYLVGVPALAALVRARPRGWLNIALPLGAGWLVATFVALTMHGWWWPGRQVVVVVPAAVLAVAWWGSNVVRGRRWLAPVLVAGAVLGALGFVWIVAEAIFGRVTLVTEFEQTRMPLYLLGQVLLPDYRDATSTTWILHGIWLVVLGALALAGWRSVREPVSPSIPVRLAVGGRPRSVQSHTGVVARFGRLRPRVPR